MERMAPKISIIVPVYNVELYLKECIDSILAQTFTDFELILIDDGSPDLCPQICDDYAKKDKRIKVIHKENGGLSSARNAGIEIASGEYLGFIDGDDWIVSKMFSKMLALMEEYAGDIVVCEYEEVDETVTQLMSLGNCEPEVKTFNNIEALKQIYGDLNVKMVIACNKLYKKSLFDEIRYPEGKVHEDEYIIHELLYRANRIVYTNEVLYAYVQRRGSIMHQFFNLARLNAIEALICRVLFFEQKNLKELQYLSECKALLFTMDTYINVKKFMKDKKLLLSELRKKVRYLYKEYSQKNSFDLKLKLKVRIFMLSPTLFQCLKGIKRKLL